MTRAARQPVAPSAPAPKLAPVKPRMLLVDLVTFRLTYFAGQRPDLRTMRRWIDSGQLPGVVIAGWYYVDVMALERRTGDPLVDKFLSENQSGE